MILGEELNQWGEPTVPRSKPQVVSKMEKTEPESIVLEDMYLTLRFLSEVTEAEPTAEDKKEKILKKARIARDNYKYAQEEFFNGMESLGINQDEARVLWADADT